MLKIGKKVNVYGANNSSTISLNGTQVSRSVQTKPLVVCPCFAVDERLDNPLCVDQLHTSVGDLVNQALGDVTQLRHHHRGTQLSSWKKK